MSFIDGIKHWASDTGRGIASVGNDIADAAGKVADDVSHGEIINAGSDLVTGTAHVVDAHSRGISQVLGAAALLPTPASPFLAIGAGSFAAFNTVKDVRDGASIATTAFDAIGVIPGLAGAAKVAAPLGSTVQALGVAAKTYGIGPGITAGRLASAEVGNVVHAANGQ